EGMGSVYQGDVLKPDPDGTFRECASPDMQKFLTALLVPHTPVKALITTQMTPKELEGRDGCLVHKLEPMTKQDAVASFRARGVSGTRAELELAANGCGNHPLSLTLLIGMVLRDPERMGDILSAKRADPDLVPSEPNRTHHVLEHVVGALSPALKKVLEC